MNDSFIFIFHFLGKFYLLLWEGENTVSVVRDVDIVEPQLDRVIVGENVSVKVHRRTYVGKVAAIGMRHIHKRVL